MKRALITGISSQAGTYLAELLLGKGYEVHGIMYPGAAARFEGTGAPAGGAQRPVSLHRADMSDTAGLIRVVQSVAPHELYHLAAQSRGLSSFERPEYAAETEGVGTLRLLEGVRLSGLGAHTRFLHASSCELFGNAGEIPQREGTAFYPRSPYAVAKLYGHWITVNYRDAYDMYACNAIPFNQESPLQDERAVARRITRGLARVCLGLKHCVQLDSLDARRDWGHARDYVQAYWLMLQQAVPRDFVVATGEQHTVRDFVEAAARELGMRLRWKGFAGRETAVVAKLERPHAGVSLGQTVVRVDRDASLPVDVDSSLGDASAAREALGWRPSTTFDALVAEMVSHDLSLAQRDALCQEQGFRMHVYQD